MDTKRKRAKMSWKRNILTSSSLTRSFFHVMILFTLLRISKGSTVIKSCCENCDSATTTPTGSASSQDICSICAHRLRVVFIAARCRLKKKNKTDGSLSKSDIRTKHFDQLHSWFFIFYNFQLSTEDIQDNRHSMYDLVYCWAPQNDNAMHKIVQNFLQLSTGILSPQ